MATQLNTPKIERRWWKVLLTVLFVVYLIGMWMIPSPQTSDEDAPSPEKRQGKLADPRETDVFEFRNRTLWIPKRYEAIRNQKRDVIVQSFPIDFLSSSNRKTVRSGPKVSFSLPSYHRDRDTNLNGAVALEAWQQSNGNPNPEWDSEIELFNFGNEEARYYYSESYSSPTAGPFFIICQAATHSVAYSVRPIHLCSVGYLVHSFVFLEYSFFLPEGQKPRGWKDLDHTIRKFSYAAVWYDGEVSSIPASEGYDREGRRLANIGAVTLRFPTRQGTHSFAGPGPSNFLRFNICVDEDTHISDCPRIADQVRVILQAVKPGPMPNDAEETLARVTRSLAVGPIPTTNSNVDEYRYSEESVSRTYVLRELDTSGRFPTVSCYSWCRSRFTAAPGLRVTYDFEPTFHEEWPRINTAVRESIADLISSPTAQ